MKFRTFITPLTAVAGLVFVVGLALLGGLLLRNPLAVIDQGGLRTPAALQFIPKQSTLVASVLVRPDRLTDVWEFLSAPNLRQATRRDIDQIKQTLLAGTGLTYEQDILPWLGEEVTAAVVSSDVDQNPDNGREPGYFIALSCKDSPAARSRLELFWQNRAIAGDALTFEDFAGNRLIYSTPRNRVDRLTPGNFVNVRSFNQLATTIVANQFVLVANHPEVLRQALNAAQSNDSNLAADRRYRSALRALPEKRVGLLALSLPALGKSLQSTSEPIDRLPALATLGEPQEEVDWGLVSLGLTREGILGDIALLAAPGHRLTPHQAALSALPRVATYLPDQAAVTAIGLNFSTLWSGLQPFWRYVSPGTMATGWIEQDLARLMNNDFAPNLLHAVVGEFALEANPGSQPDWLLVTEKNPALEGALHDFLTAAQAEGLGVNTLTVQGQPTQALTRLTLKPSLQGSPVRSLEVLAQVVGLQAQVEDVTILAASPGAMDATLRQWKTASVPPDWAEYLALFQRPNEGYIHINWPRLQSGLRQQISRFRLWETAAQPVLQHLKRIMLTSYGRTQELQTGRIFFQLSNQ